MTVVKCVCVLVCLYVLGFQSVHQWLLSSEQFLHKLLGGWVIYTMVLEIETTVFVSRFFDLHNLPYIQEDLLCGFLGVIHL
jgi:hypothetical protein